MDFLATFLGAAFGVMAGAAIQYLAQMWIDRNNRQAVLSDLRKEAQYNLGVANDMLDEVAKFRAAAQPDTFATYQWFFRSKDMLGTVLNGVINSGQLYRMFTQREITEIQQLRQFFDPNLESTFIATRISQYKESKNYAEALMFANHLAENRHPKEHCQQAISGYLLAHTISLGFSPTRRSRQLGGSLIGQGLGDAASPRSMAM